MAVHRIAPGNLDESLRALVRGSAEPIDSLTFDAEADEWVVITTDRIETREWTPHGYATVTRVAGEVVSVRGNG